MLGQAADPDYDLIDLYADHLGSTRVTAADGGEILSQTTYLPFGETTRQPAEAWNTHLYTGHERDAGTGLDYMRARYYGASVGRFLSPDLVDGTVHDTQSWDLYSYVRNDPTLLTDPFGLYWVPMPVMPGDPNGCTMCIRAVAGDKDATPEDLQRTEQDAWSYYQANREKLEKYYSAFGVGPEQVEKWFTPGQGPKVRVRTNMTDPGKTRGWRISVSANQRFEVPGSTVAHELLHRRQFFRLRVGPDPGMHFPADLTQATWAEMKRRGAKTRKREFWAYALEAYINE